MKGEREKSHVILSEFKIWDPLLSNQGPVDAGYATESQWFQYCDTIMSYLMSIPFV